MSLAIAIYIETYKKLFGIPASMSGYRRRSTESTQPELAMHNSMQLNPFDWRQFSPRFLIVISARQLQLGDEMRPRPAVLRD